LINW